MIYYVVVNNLIIKECKDYKMVNRVIEKIVNYPLNYDHCSNYILFIVEKILTWG